MKVALEETKALLAGDSSHSPHFTPDKIKSRDTEGVKQWQSPSPSLKRVAANGDGTAICTPNMGSVKNIEADGKLNKTNVSVELEDPSDVEESKRKPEAAAASLVYEYMVTGSGQVDSPINLLESPVVVRKMGPKSPALARANPPIDPEPTALLSSEHAAERVPDNGSSTRKMMDHSNEKVLIEGDNVDDISLGSLASPDSHFLPFSDDEPPSPVQSPKDESGAPTLDGDDTKSDDYESVIETPRNVVFLTLKRYSSDKKPNKVFQNQTNTPSQKGISSTFDTPPRVDQKDPQQQSCVISDCIPDNKSKNSTLGAYRKTPYPKKIPEEHMSSS